MLGNTGVEVCGITDPQLNWKTDSKGKSRASRRPRASFNIEHKKKFLAKDLNGTGDHTNKYLKTREISVLQSGKISKQAKRKSKRLMHLASIVVASVEGNEDIRISSREVNPYPHVSTSHPHYPPTTQPNNSQHSFTPTHSSNSLDTSNREDDQFPNKKKRGKTMMRSVSLIPSKRAKVEFNKRGQPIGVTSTYLSSYLGTLARETIPMNIHDWRKVSNELKEDLWTIIKTTFKLEEMQKSLFIKMLGHRWREGKSRLVSALKDASKCPDATSKISSLKPDNIKSVQDWNDFVKEKLSDEFELKSKKFKAIREKNKIAHTMSRKGYARLEDDMRKESGCPSDITREDLWCKGHTRRNGEPPNPVVADCLAKIKENSLSQSSRSTLPLSKDGVSKVFGPERNGRVRGIGFGVAPSQLGIHTSSSKKYSELKNEVTDLRAQLQELTSLFRASRKGNINEDTYTPQANTSQSQNGSTNFGISTNVHIGDPSKKCKLLNWQNKIVAEGTLSSTDPNALVHHIPLGASGWKVWVNVALDSQAPLWRPSSDMSTIQDVVGTTVAWHKDFVSFE